MKRLALAAALAAGGLTGIALPATGAAEVRVLACEPEWAALAEEIGAGNVTVHSATHGRQDPHHIRARPSLIAQVRRADLLFCSGADLEVGWLPVLMQRGARIEVQPGQAGNLMAADHVELLGRPEVVDRSLGDIPPERESPRPSEPRERSVARIGACAPTRTDRFGPIALAYRERLASFLDRWNGRDGALARTRLASAGHAGCRPPQGMGLSHPLGRARARRGAGADIGNSTHGCRSEERPRAGERERTSRPSSGHPTSRPMHRAGSRKGPAFRWSSFRIPSAGSARPTISSRCSR